MGAFWRPGTYLILSQNFQQVQNKSKFIPGIHDMSACVYLINISGHSAGSVEGEGLGGLQPPTFLKIIKSC